MDDAIRDLWSHPPIGRARPVMRPARDNNGDRLARIDAMLGHLRELEKDTGKIISSLQRERERTSADMAMNALHAVRGRTGATSRKPRKRPGSSHGRNGR